MAAPRIATTGPAKQLEDPSRAAELITAYQLESQAAIKAINDKTLVEIQKLATRVGQLADLVVNLESRVDQIQRSFSDYEFRFGQSLKEAGEILRTSVTHSESAKKRVDVFEKLAEKQGNGERRDISALQVSVGQLRDALAQMDQRQNQLQGYVSETLTQAGLVHEYVNSRALQHRPAGVVDD